MPCEKSEARSKKSEAGRKPPCGSGEMSWIMVGVLFATIFLAPPMAGAAEGEISIEVRHHHAIGSCRGTLILDSHGARYETNHKQDARVWAYEDIRQWQVENGGKLKIYSYEDRKWRLGADKTFQFDWAAGKVTSQQVDEFLKAHTARPIAAWLLPAETGKAIYEFPVKHLGGRGGNQGRLLFTDQLVMYQSDQKDANRNWCYQDLESIASAGIYDLTLTTYEQQKFHYASRRVYNFQLKRGLTPETYDELWRFVNQKKGLGLYGPVGPGQEIR